MCVGVREIERGCMLVTYKQIAERNEIPRDGVLCLRERKIFHNESDS